KNVEQFSGALHGVDERAADDRAKRPQAELERAHDAEVATPTAHGPEQVWMLGRACANLCAISRHELDGQETVDGQTAVAHEPTQAAAQRETGHTGRRNLAASDCQPVR